MTGFLHWLATYALASGIVTSLLLALLCGAARLRGEEAMHPLVWITVAASSALALAWWIT